MPLLALPTQLNPAVGLINNPLGVEQCAVELAPVSELVDPSAWLCGAELFCARVLRDTAWQNGRCPQ